MADGDVMSRIPMPNIQETKLLDARGLLCPMPIVKAGKEIKSLAPGEILKILATDRGAIADFPAWADDTGNELLEWHEEAGGVLVFLIKKAEDD
jgi:TusA-related sulfurtransferase